MNSIVSGQEAYTQSHFEICSLLFLGITNFDLLGDFGRIEWLGNFRIVLLYNLVFAASATLCLVNKFTATVRRELYNRYALFYNKKTTNL